MQKHIFMHSILFLKSVITHTIGKAAEMSASLQCGCKRKTHQSIQLHFGDIKSDIV